MMNVSPIPFFETQSRFNKLNLDTLENEQSQVRAFLLAQDAATDARKSYKVVRLFLSNFRNNGSYNVYRTQIEKLLSWSIYIAAKPINLLDANDVYEFFEFCNDPPTHWVSAYSHQRFTRTNGRKRGSITAYIINSDWRPFVAASADDCSSSGDTAPLADLRVHNKTSLPQLASVCRSFFLFLGGEDLMSINPMQEIDRSGQYVQTPAADGPLGVFSPSEWLYITKAMDDLIAKDSSHERTRFVVMSAFHLLLKPGDFDKYSGTLRMSDFFYDDDDRMYLNLGVGGKGLITVQVPEDYRTIHLARYRRHVGTHLIPLARDSTPLFSTNAGRPGLSRRHVNLLFQMVLAEAAVAMADDGCSEEDIQKIKFGSIKWVRQTSINVGTNHTPLQISSRSA
ncbi:hypothetical protein AABC73_13385 [Pseudomonas sp. G.S.17]|uniref:hypothetical protein n=1 Tax=Pseudomonas sp. G.S.17 TaxID=3137451 RepID=UPI00311CDD28